MAFTTQSQKAAYFAKIKPGDPMKKRNAQGEALADLHSMLGEAISQKLKAKASAKQDRSKAKADSPAEELGEEGKEMDADDPKAARKKLAFGHGGK